MRLVTGGMTVHVLDMQETINAHTGGWGNFYIYLVTMVIWYQFQESSDYNHYLVGG